MDSFFEMGLLSKTQELSGSGTWGSPECLNFCSLKVRKLTEKVTRSSRTTRRRFLSFPRKSLSRSGSRGGWAEPGEAAPLCGTKGEDLEFPGAFLEGGAEAQPEEEGRG